MGSCWILFSCPCESIVIVAMFVLLAALLLFTIETLVKVIAEGVKLLLDA